MKDVSDVSKTFQHSIIHTGTSQIAPGDAKPLRLFDSIARPKIKEPRQEFRTGPKKRKGQKSKERTKDKGEPRVEHLPSIEKGWVKKEVEKGRERMC